MSLARIIGAAIVLDLVVVGGDRVDILQQPPATQSFFHLLEATIPTCIAAFRKVS